MVNTTGCIIHIYGVDLKGLGQKTPKLEIGFIKNQKTMKEPRINTPLAHVCLTDALTSNSMRHVARTHAFVTQVTCE